MVFLFVFLTIIIVVFTGIIFSKIVIEINNLHISTNKLKKLNNDYKVIFRIYLFGKIPIIKTIYTNRKIKQLKINNKFKKIKLQHIVKQLRKNTRIDKKIAKIFIKDMFEIINIKLKIEIGTQNATLTAILVGIISTILSIVLRSKINNIKKQKFKIIPIYNKNIVNINISGIFAIKVIHIINIIYILIKEKGEIKYERTSNRKTYDYSYE